MKKLYSILLILISILYLTFLNPKFEFKAIEPKFQLRASFLYDLILVITGMATDLISSGTPISISFATSLLNQLNYILNMLLSTD
jgi:hypothetical protein